MKSRPSARGTTAGYSGTPLVTKLGIKPANAVLVLGAPAGYRAWLDGLPKDVRFVTTASGSTDFAHIFCTKKSEMAKTVMALRRKVPPAAIIWVSWPKKSSRVETDITEDIVREVALPLGLVDVKVCAIDDVWSGLKLVVRKDLR